MKQLVVLRIPTYSKVGVILVESDEIHRHIGRPQLQKGPANGVFEKENQSTLVLLD